ncbi:MAG: bile acid:sodium symporter family protein [Bacteroidales bacterium]|nr:bile acid:sodium symporter family protein [Bacteroidales bacterium]
MEQALQVLDEVRLNFSPSGLLVLNISLAFIMFGVALEINTENFKKILKHPKSAVIGFLSQFLILPALTFLLVLLIQPTASVALGMLLVASCPGGNISNFISHLARGNTALSVTLTGFATLGSIFLTPLNFAFWGGLYEKASNLIMPIEIDPWHMLQTVVILLGIPMVLGVLFSRKFPETTRRIVRPIKIMSIIIFAGFVVVALSNNFSYFIEYIHLIFLIVLAHNGLALVAGFSIGTAFNLPRIDRRSVTIETGIQNSGLALVLIFNPNIFGGLGGMAFIAAWWGIWHIIAGMVIAGIWSRKPLQKRDNSLVWQRKGV